MINNTISIGSDAQGNIMSTYTQDYQHNGNRDLYLSEVELYGSSRIGLKLIDKKVSELSSPSPNLFYRGLGLKRYEISNHLGNVLTTFTDQKKELQNANTVTGYAANIKSSQDYYPFGMIMNGRNYNTSEYRFGFNGKESDNEVKGVGNSLDFGARIYDSRTGRWLSVDPKFYKYPYLSSYNAFENNPVCILDPGGDTTIYFSQKGDLLHTSNDKLPTAIIIINDKNLNGFNISLKVFKEKGKNDLSSSDAANSRWRKLGLNVDVNLIRKFYNSNCIDGKDNLTKESSTGKYAQGYFNEIKSLLYEKDGNTIIGNEEIIGNLKNVTGDPENEPNLGTKVGKIHTHPNEGLRDFGGTFGYGPSDTDIHNQGSINIVVGNKQIYIYGKSIDNTITIDKKTLKKGELK